MDRGQVTLPTPDAMAERIRVRREAVVALKRLPRVVKGAPTAQALRARRECVPVNPISGKRATADR